MLQRRQRETLLNVPAASFGGRVAGSHAPGAHVKVVSHPRAVELRD